MEKCFPSPAPICPLRSQLTSRPLVLPWSSSSSSSSSYYSVNGSPVLLPPEKIAEIRTASASKSHSETERRRRERINTHLSTLRNLVPSATKVDKASVLQRVIDQMKDLKRKAVEIEQFFPIPTEMDEVTIESDRNFDFYSKKLDENSKNIGKETTIIRASVCCDDRPELYIDLMKALHDLKLKTLKANISTFGGRVRNVLILSSKEDAGDEKEEPTCISTLKESLKLVLMKIAASGTGTPTFSSISSKRQRMFHLTSLVSHSNI